MLHVNAEGMYIALVLTKSIHANLKQACLSSEEANVLLSVNLSGTGL